MNFLSTSLTAAASVSNAFVVVMGIGVVFIGLICIILLIKLMSVIMGSVGGKQVDSPAATPTPATATTTPVAGATPAASPAPAISSVIENRGEIVAAVCAAAAEELGTDVSALRVVSFKKIS